MSEKVGTHPLRHGSRTAVIRDSRQFPARRDLGMANDVTYTTHAALGDNGGSEPCSEADLGWTESGEDAAAAGDGGGCISGLQEVEAAARA